MSDAKRNLIVSLDRADEMRAELRTEYDRSLHKKEVSGRAVHLSHEVLELVSNVLDRVARLYWTRIALSRQRRAPRRL